MALFGGKTLYYSGCVTQFFLKDIQHNYEKLLKLCNVEFIKLNELKCCGIEAMESGYRKEFYDVLDENETLLRSFKVNKVITNCAKCYRTFKGSYGMQTEHVLHILLNNVHLLKEQTGDVTYYDGPELGRKSLIHDEPREILEAVGYKVIELKDNKRMTNCCGVGGGLERNSPRVAEKIAKMVLSKVKTDVLVVADPICYKHLKANATNVKVLELSEVLL